MHTVLYLTCDSLASALLKYSGGRSDGFGDDNVWPDDNAWPDDNVWPVDELL